MGNQFPHWTCQYKSYATFTMPRQHLKFLQYWFILALASLACPKDEPIFQMHIRCWFVIESGRSSSRSSVLNWDFSMGYIHNVNWHTHYLQIDTNWDAESHELQLLFLKYTRWMHRNGMQLLAYSPQPK
jgi:hypothetical protein